MQSPGARPSDATRAAGSIDEPGGPGGGDAAGGGHADGFRLPGFAVDHEVGLSVATWLIAVTVGVVLFAATYQGRGLVVELPGELSVLVLKRRRGAPRDTAQPDSAAEPAAAPDAAVDDAPGSTADGAPRDHVQVRIESPLDDGDTGRGPRRFDAPPAPRVERRAIAYQSVRLSGGPDDLRSAEIARLRRRDEVEIIGEEGSAVRVRTPEGLEGWVPRIVLVGLPAASIAPPAAPAEGMTRPSRRGWRRPPHGPAGSPRSA